MDLIYKVKSYEKTKWNEDTEETTAVCIEGDIDELSELIKQSDKSYHIRLRSSKSCIVFGDVDHYENEELFNELLDELVKYFEVDKSEISYTRCQKDINEYSYHFSIPTIESNFYSLKYMFNNDKGHFYKYKIDLSVYCNKWFRLPNQTNINKPLKHVIIQGTEADFIVQNIDRVENRFIEKEPEPIIKTISQSLETNNDVLKDINNKVLKMVGCFDSYNSWLELCFIIYNSSDGSAEGKTLFIELCKKVCKQFDEEECNKKWYSVKTNSQKKLSIGTLNKKYYELYPDEQKQLHQQKKQELKKFTLQKLQELQESKFTHNDYYIEKEKFEKRIFRLDSPFYYVKINEDGTIEFLDLDKLSKWSLGEYKKITYIIGEDENTGKTKTKEYNFIDIWKDDPNKLKKNKIIFDPSTTNNLNDYNCWKGFDFVDTEPVNEENSLFLKLLKRLTNDEINYEYLKQWIAHIIQKPYMKTKVAIVLYSECKGVGKNCIVDGINRLLRNYTANVGSIDDIVKNFNAHLVNKLFISGDEICARAKAVSDKLKETITRPTQNLEKKGKDSIQVNDYTNWLFTTNNYDAFKIEGGDRRMNMVHCIEEPFKESEDFYKEINNKDDMCKLFNFFKSYKITYKLGVEPPPISQYKQELQYNNKEGYIQMLYKEPYKFLDNFTPIELFKITNEYCKINYLPQNTNINSFSKYMTNLFNDYKKRSDTTYKYKLDKLDINQLQQILYNNDKLYWKYINDYKENEEPDFNKINKKNTDF